jgi:hypothetical protein
MNATSVKLLFAAATTAVALGASITRADEQPVVYGRAGYPVAEERIKQLTQAPSRDTVRDETAVVWYGRAGYPVGPDTVRATVPTPKVYAAGQTRAPTVYGRAGVPLPFPY